jgi:hypothetical protein
MDSVQPPPPSHSHPVLTSELSSLPPSSSLSSPPLHTQAPTQQAQHPSQLAQPLQQRPAHFSSNATHPSPAYSSTHAMNSQQPSQPQAGQGAVVDKEVKVEEKGASRSHTRSRRRERLGEAASGKFAGLLTCSGGQGGEAGATESPTRVSETLLRDACCPSKRRSRVDLRKGGGASRRLRLATTLTNSKTSD